MNVWLFSAGIVCGITALIHTFAGQSLINVFLSATLPRLVKSTLLACWHMVTVMLFVTSGMLLWAAWALPETLQPLLAFIATLFLGFGVVCIGAGVWFYRLQGWWRLPQWVLLAPVGALSWAGILA